MLSILRFVGRRVALRLGRRSRWVSRGLMIVAAAQYVNRRVRARRVVELGREDTLVISVEHGETGSRVV